MSQISQNHTQEPEEPVFLIERQEDREEPNTASNLAAQALELLKERQGGKEEPPKPRHPWLRWLLGVVAAAALALLAIWGYRAWLHQRDHNIPVSATPEENIAKLQQPPRTEKPGVVMTSDSILGVALDFYALHGVRASIEWVEPDTLDQSVFLYCRSADHKADSLYLGSLVVNGEEKPSYEGRMGYMAMTADRFVVGVSESEAVKDYVMEQGGSFFRQMVLVSNGVLPHQFELHGKVERKAIGRIGEQYYFVVTRSKETMWDFADALREYGFLDAIYITGGDNYSFYRTADGVKHDIGNVTEYPHKKWKGIIPWLVFRKL